MKFSASGLAWLSTLLLSGAACAADPAKAPPTLAERLAHLGYQQGGDVKSVPHYELDGWRKVDEAHFIMDAGPSRYYLISLRYACPGVDFVENLGFSTTPPGDLTPFDEIIVRQPGVPEHCPIDRISTLTKLGKPEGK